MTRPYMARLHSRFLKGNVERPCRKKIVVVSIKPLSSTFKNINDLLHDRSIVV